VKLVGHNWVWKLSQKLLQKCRNLHRSFFRKIDSLAPLIVDQLSELSKPPYVSVLAKDTLNRHIHIPHCCDGEIHKCRDPESARANTIGGFSPITLHHLLQRLSENALFLGYLFVSLESFAKTIPESRPLGLDKI
jgi:hypothetical protein